MPKAKRASSNKKTGVVGMKISHICPFVGEQMGGSERYVWTLSKAQSREHDVHIYTTTKYLDRVGTCLHLWQSGISIP
jgi:hypothetical protein